MKEVKLNKSEIKLFEGFRTEMGTAIQAVQRLISEVLHYRITEIGEEKGVDFENENWVFDAETYTFTRQEPKPEPGEVIPKKRGTTKKSNAKIPAKKEK